MMVLKKKEIIAGALVMLIGVAGYLNWSYQDTIRVTDNDSYIETGKKLGEAQYVNAPAEIEDNSKDNAKDNAQTSSQAPEENMADYFMTAKSEKESARSRSLEILKQTAENESFDSEIRKKAQEQILSLSTNIEKETAIENIIKAKAYNEVSVYIDSDNVDIMVRKKEFNDNDAMILKQAATEQLKISSKNIKIVEIK